MDIGVPIHDGDGESEALPGVEVAPLFSISRTVNTRAVCPDAARLLATMRELRSGRAQMALVGNDAAILKE